MHARLPCSVRPSCSIWNRQLIGLIRQSSESLAGRICYLELSGLSVLELGAAASERLWIRGGFPDSMQAPGDASSSIWREQFIRT